MRMFREAEAAAGAMAEYLRGFVAEAEERGEADRPFVVGAIAALSSDVGRKDT